MFPRKTESDRYLQIPCFIPGCGLTLFKGAINASGVRRMGGWCECGGDTERVKSGATNISCCADVEDCMEGGCCSGDVSD